MNADDTTEQEQKELYERIRKGILLAQKKLFERKAKLGEPVVVGDENGLPKVIPASEALENLKRKHPDI